MRSLAITFLFPFILSGAADGQAFEKAEFEASTGDSLRYAILRPAGVEEGKKYPLVVTLHGVGGRGKANWVGNCYANKVLSKPEMREKFPCFVVAPTCAKEETWWSAGKLKGKGRIPDVLELVEHLIGAEVIDPSRVYVTGQSMGGFGTFAAIAARPDLFAAAAPVCGGGDLGGAEKIAGVPVWVFHGVKDETVPVGRSREMVEAIKKAGGEPEYTEFPSVGHGAWTPAYDSAELWGWMFAQRRK